MALTAEEKTQIINEYATHEGDTGSLIERLGLRR